MPIVDQAAVTKVPQTMPFWGAEQKIKAVLPRLDGSIEKRVVTLPNGAATTVDEFLSILTERFQSPIQPTATYSDADGDRITLSTDVELAEALTSNVTQFGISLAPVSQLSDDDDWTMLSHAAALDDVEDVKWVTEINFWVNGQPVQFVP